MAADSHIEAGTARSKDTLHPLPGQVVLVFQGGGALGAYQVGVYEALHEAGVEPDWVIGTSIGAINGAIVAGNPPEHRLQRLYEFWSRMEHHSRMFPGISNMVANLVTITQGIPAFFSPNPSSWHGLHTSVGIERASYYITKPLEATLASLVDFDFLNSAQTRLTVGAVNARNGEMCYFDSRDMELRSTHVMASSALPPAFPAVRIDGEPYWDGGIYSNTPIEAVLDDQPRRDSVIFSVQIWNPEGPEPKSLWQVIGKQKDIQYASRANNIERQRQIHHLRHVIHELTRHLPDEKRDSAECRELTSWGCSTVMHVIKLNAPPLDGEDHTKDIDFTSDGIRARRNAGYRQTKAILGCHPWTLEIDSIDGMQIHETAWPCFECSS